jgi:hypothetical protein
MKSWARLLIILGAALAAIHDAQAHVVIHVDKSRQRMSVSIDGESRYSFVVSTGRAGYGTPNGVYHPLRMERTWFSKKYYNSPMPHAIFFRGGYAIHGSYEISRLGGPASHGCIRLHPDDAAVLYELVKREGVGGTSIVVSGANPSHREVAREPRSPWQVTPPSEADGNSGEATSYRRAYPYVSSYSYPYLHPYVGDRLQPDTMRRPPRSLYNRGWRPFFGSDNDY